MSKPPIIAAFENLQDALRICSGAHQNAELTLPRETFEAMRRILAGYQRSGEIAAVDLSAGSFMWDGLTVRRGK